MSIRVWSLAALALLAIPLVAAAAGASREAVHGRLNAVASGGAERGDFRLATLDRANGAHAERVEAAARHLNVTGASVANPPSFHVFLIKSDGSGAADFGAMRVNRRGVGALRFDTRRAADVLPSGVTTITDFGGGTIEVRDGSGSAVLSGTIPSFGGGASGSRTFGRAAARLASVSSSFRGRGEITARRQNLAHTAQEEMSVACTHMTASTTYTVVAIASDTTETSLGTFTTGSPLGVGGFRIATAQGGTIPGGSVLDLAGETVEVRDSSNSAVLTGTFPTIP